MSDAAERGESSEHVIGRPSGGGHVLDDQEPETLSQLRNVAKRRHWVLEGTYYADTGEAPASKAVFGNVEEAAEGKRLLQTAQTDPSQVRSRWQAVSSDAVELDDFVAKANEALADLRAKRHELRPDPS